MICERVFGLLENAPFAIPVDGREHDQIELTWQESGKRFLRKISRAGRDVGIVLPVGVDLSHGAVIHCDPQLLVSVSILACVVTVIGADNPQELARAAYELGNLHRPLEITTEGVLTPQADDLDAFLFRCGFTCQHGMRRFKPYTPQGIPLPRLGENFQIISACIQSAGSLE